MLRKITAGICTGTAIIVVAILSTLNLLIDDSIKGTKKAAKYLEQEINASLILVAEYSKEVTLCMFWFCVGFCRGLAS